MHVKLPEGRLKEWRKLGGRLEKEWRETGGRLEEEWTETGERAEGDRRKIGSGRRSYRTDHNDSDSRSWPERIRQNLLSQDLNLKSDLKNAYALIWISSPSLLRNLNSVTGIEVSISIITQRLYFHHHMRRFERKPFVK